MIRKVPVSVIMTQSVICLKKKIPLRMQSIYLKCAILGNIPIVDGKSIIGMLSKTDL